MNADRPASRLSLVSEAGPAKPRRRKGALQDHKCGPCSELFKADVTALQERLLSAVVRDGKVVGGELMWCCAECGRPYYKIKTVSKV